MNGELIMLMEGNQMIFDFYYHERVCRDRRGRRPYGATFTFFA